MPLSTLGTHARNILYASDGLSELKLEHKNQVASTATSKIKKLLGSAGKMVAEIALGFQVMVPIEIAGRPSDGKDTASGQDLLPSPFWRKLQSLASSARSAARQCSRVYRFTSCPSDMRVLVACMACTPQLTRRRLLYGANDDSQQVAVRQSRLSGVHQSASIVARLTKVPVGWIRARNSHLVSRLPAKSEPARDLAGKLATQQRREG